MTDEGKDDKRAREKTVLERLGNSAVIVALITSFSSLILSYASADEKRCEIATSFFNDEKDATLYDEEEWKQIKRAYIRMLRSCR